MFEVFATILAVVIWFSIISVTYGAWMMRDTAIIGGIARAVVERYTHLTWILYDGVLLALAIFAIVNDFAPISLTVYLIYGTGIVVTSYYHVRKHPVTN